MNNNVDTVEHKIQNAILTAIDNIVALKIELAIRLINASSGRDATSVAANSDCRERVGINASFENASENNNIHQVLNKNDETRNNFPDEVSELSVPGTRFDRKSHNHHSHGMSFTKREGVSQHVCEVCGKLLPKLKDMPGSSSTNQKLKTENFNQS